MIGAAVISFAITAAGAVEQSSADAAAKKIYDTQCTRCHKHHDISLYGDKAWKRLLWKMKNKARLDDEDYGDLSDYLKRAREAERRSKNKP